VNSDDFILKLHSDATLHRDSDEAIVAQRGTRLLRLPGVGRGVGAALSLLQDGADLGTLLACAAERDGSDASASLIYYLRLLERHGCVTRGVCVDGVPIATAEHFAPGHGTALAAAATYALSRFAYLRADRDTLIVGSPLSRCTVALHDGRAAALVQRLASGMRCAEDSELPRGAAGLLVALLMGAGMLVVAGEPEAEPLRTWEFHDLLFHTYSREGRRERPSGATYRFVGDMPAPPVLGASRGRPRRLLPKPDLAHLMQVDPPFAAVQERRCSIRSFGEQPITEAQLGEFLFRVARVTHTVTTTRATPRGPIESTMAHRPYPGGGGLYELEIYPLVARADGIPGGLYRYDPAEHELELISSRTPVVDSLLIRASRGTGVPPDQIQVLLVIAARFARFAWKYEAMAYAAILKNVGVLYQTMYLVATAMGLAPCAVGSGDSDAFADAAQTHYLAETSVGEFLLGSSAASE
jgi:SagB-type dehydrogenase family enzyme